MRIPPTPQEKIRQLLQKLGFAPHHTGYKLLIQATLLYSENNAQSITKGIYPSLAKQFGYFKSTAIEHPIRYAISEAWAHGNPAVWKRYFPRYEKAPSNMAFIAALAEHLK